jgi:Flp pilus assembly protein TadB
MNDPSAPEIIGIFASIIALIFFFGNYAIRIQLKAKKKREEAEQSLKQEMERFKKAGETISARTDLGFFVLIEIESLRRSASSTLHLKTLIFVMIGAFLTCIAIIRIVGHNDLSTFNAILSDAIFAVVFVLLAISLHAQRSHDKLEKYLTDYERRVKEIWQHPVDKQAYPENGGAQPS